MQNSTPIGVTVAEMSVGAQKHVYRRRYENRRSSKPKLHLKKNKKYGGKTILNIADGILTPCNMT